MLDQLADLAGCRPRFGEGHHMARISDADVLRIREARRQGETYRSIAARFGVSPGTVCDLVSCRRRQRTQAPVRITHDHADTLLE